MSTVNVSVTNSTGRIELNRPKALNSLNHEMVDVISDALDAWIDDDSIHRVLITSSTDRAFCAGGDVRTVREQGLAGDYDSGDQFFADEYVMNNDLATFPKPIVSVLNGVTMGGGLGVSAHGSHRIVTERAFAAMPEMAIGFIPDVGMTWMMSHMSDVAGLATFLAVTGWRLSPADMMWSGMATNYIDSSDVDEFIEVVIAESLDEALDRFEVLCPEPSRLAAYEQEITECFAFDTWEEIDAALHACKNEEFVAQVRELMRAASPTSVVGAVELIAANRTVEDIRHALDNELSMGNLLRRSHDFAEGVRAVLVDKDRNPAFDPATFDAVDVDQLRSCIVRK